MVPLRYINAPHQSILINIMCHSLHIPWVRTSPAGQAPRSQLSNLGTRGTAISLTKPTLPGDCLAQSQPKRTGRTQRSLGSLRAGGGSIRLLSPRAPPTPEARTAEPFILSPVRSSNSVTQCSFPSMVLWTFRIFYLLITCS